MTTSRTLRAASLLAGAFALLAALVFLFARTQSTDYKASAETLALLRELKDLDTRWDAEAKRLADDFGSSSAPAPDRAGAAARILNELRRGPGGAALGERLPGLAAAMSEKQAESRILRAAHGRSLEAIGAARDSLSALAGAAASARLRGGANGERPAILLAHIEQVRATLRDTDIEAQAEIERALEPQAATLVPAAVAVSTELSGPARKAEQAVRGFAAARRAEAQAWRKFSFLTLGARIDLAARELGKAIQGSLDETDRWRAYLFAYAAALLIGAGYLATRVFAAQAALRDANELLEKRVAERTSELTRALKQLQESEAQLVQSEKMSSLGRLVAGVAHEINTPLAYVKNSVAALRERMAELREALGQAERLLGMLQSEAPDPEELRGAFAALSARLARLADHHVLSDLESLSRDGLHGIDQIAELVANLRSFARLDRSKVASFNVNEGVRATLLIAKPVLRRLDVERRLGELPSITCSPAQVNQVLLNLLTNAAQAIDEPNGRIVVSTRRAGADGVAIEVADNGRGIPADILPRIFDPFFTTKEAGKGTGLGLSIAYKIVAQHGGRIDVRSLAGEGTTFTVTLPIAPSPELAPEALEEAAE